MNLRSGDKFENTLDSMKELYPTPEQINSLSIKATRKDVLYNHIQWLLSHHHGPSGKNHHLIIFATVESILISEEYLLTFKCFRTLLQTARRKLANCENPIGEFTRYQYVTRINRAIGCIED